MDKGNVPALRFSEFSGEWEPKKLGQLVEFQSGFAFSSKFFTNKGMKLVTPKNFTKIGFGKFNSANTKYTSEVVDKKYICSVGDLLVLLTDLTPSCELLGKPLQLKQVDGDVLLNQRIVRVDVDELLVASSFIKGFLLSEKYHKRIISTASGTTVRHSSNKILKETPIFIPTLPEQQKIAAFLGAVDKKISQLERKKSLLERYKKGCMQKLFPSTSGQAPELRFKDKQGNDYPDWQETIIGKLGHFYYGKNAPKFSVFPDAPTPCIRYGELYNKYSIVINEVISRTIIDPQKLRFSKGEEILVPRVGEDPLDFAIKCCYLPLENIAIGEMISVFTTKENPLFYTYYFRTLKTQFARVVEGGNVSNLYYKYLETIKIWIPHPDEQQKIANFLTSLDNKIDLNSQALDKLRNFKKGLLQQMFV